MLSLPRYHVRKIWYFHTLNTHAGSLRAHVCRFIIRCNECDIYECDIYECTMQFRTFSYTLGTQDILSDPRHHVRKFIHSDILHICWGTRHQGGVSSCLSHMWHDSFSHPRHLQGGVTSCLSHMLHDLVSHPRHLHIHACAAYEWAMLYVYESWHDTLIICIIIYIQASDAKTLSCLIIMFTCDMTHSCTIHDSLICYIWMIRMQHDA